MEYRIEFPLPNPMPDIEKLACLLDAEDAAAVADFDATARVWRVSTTLATHELRLLLDQAGGATHGAQLTQLPSVCCGGCSG